MRPIVNVPNEDRATDTVHKNLAKVARVVLEIASQTDRQRERQTHRQTYSSRYFSTAPAGEVTRS